MVDVEGKVEERIHLTTGPLSIDQAFFEVKDRDYGAVLMFQGTVRQWEKGKRIKSITYEAYHEMAVSVPQFKNKKMIGNWIPRRIIVYQGQRIHLIIESLDVEHIFVLPAYKIKLPLIPGKKEHFSFTANKTGMFYFHCGNRECAPLYLHRLMVGQFIVKDEPDSKK